MKILKLKMYNENLIEGTPFEEFENFAICHKGTEKFENEIVEILYNKVCYSEFEMMNIFHILAESEIPYKKFQEILAKMEMTKEDIKKLQVNQFKSFFAALLYYSDDVENIKKYAPDFDLDAPFYVNRDITIREKIVEFGMDINYFF